MFGGYENGNTCASRNLVHRVELGRISPLVAMVFCMAVFFSGCIKCEVRYGTTEEKNVQTDVEAALQERLPHEKAEQF